MHFMESFAGTEDDVQTSLAITRAGIPFMVHTAVINDHVYPFAQREYVPRDVSCLQSAAAANATA